MEVIFKSISSLTKYEKNSRVHNNEQIEQITRSIKEFGFTNPILIDEDNIIIAGHGRLMSAKNLNMQEIPTITIKGLSLAQKKAYIIADNKIALNSSWNDEVLKSEFLEILNEDYDLSNTGFSEDELLDFNLDDLPDLDIDSSNSDNAPEPPMVPAIKKGDIIDLGYKFQHRLICGDSTDENNIIDLMQSEIAHMVFTDPPYGVSYTNEGNSSHDVIMNDDKFLDGWIPLVSKYSKGFIFVWTSYQVVGKWIEITKPFGKLTNMIVWNKGGGGDLKGAFSTDYELALVWNRKSNLQDKRIGSVWNVPKDHSSSYVHPTQKPVELMEKGIFNCSKVNNIVLDLFGGSGTTLIACENLSRRCRIMELDEKYAHVIVERYCDYTGIDTIKINGVEQSWSKIKDNLNG